MNSNAMHVSQSSDKLYTFIHRNKLKRNLKNYFVKRKKYNNKLSVNFASQFNVNFDSF